MILYGGKALLIDDAMTVIEDAVIEIKEGRIDSVRSDSKYRPKSDDVDCRGQLILPGLINCHTHVGMSLLRGRVEDVAFQEWLFERVFPLERKWGSEEFVYTSSLLGCLEMISAGITTFNDMYYFEEQTAKAVVETGMRAICAQTVIENAQMHDAGKVDEQMEAFVESVASLPRVMPAIAPHSIYAVSDATLKSVLEFSDKNSIRIHIHLAEPRDEIEACQKKTGMTPVAYCKSIGLFERPLIAAHALQVSEDDIALLGESKVGISHNPDSNLKLGNGIAPAAAFRRAGAPVGLGTDGVASNNRFDLFSTGGLAGKLQAVLERPGALTAKDLVRMMTIEGARALRLEDEIGSLEPGKKADLITVDVTGFHAMPMADPYTHLVYSARCSDVSRVWVDGALIRDSGQFLTVDASEVRARIDPWQARLQ